MSEEHQPAAESATPSAAKPQHRVTIDDDVFATLRANTRSRGKNAVSKLVNECLKNYFLTEDWKARRLDPPNPASS